MTDKAARHNRDNIPPGLLLRRRKSGQRSGPPPLEEIREKRLTAARIIRKFEGTEYEARYLPIFERLDAEVKKAESKSASLNRAHQIAHQHEQERGQI